MKQFFTNPLREIRAGSARLWPFLLILPLVTACAKPTTMDEIHDPYEATNRQIHEFNKSLDQAFLRPAGTTYASAVPNVVQVGVSNLSRHMETPASIANNVLQLNVGAAIENTVRFAINSTVGVMGFYDAAGDAGIYGSKSDFGQTLDRWGVGEGPYLELPVLGSSTVRDTTGVVVDAMFNPFNYVLPDRWKVSGPAIKTIAMVGDRGRFAETVDSVLYDSADSYAQARLFYLQSRRHELGLEVAEEDVFDPFEELYGDF